MRGGGASGVLLVSRNRYEEAHYLLQRLIKRAGFSYDHFAYTTIDELPAELPAGIKVVVPMGEFALRHTTGEPTILRWRGRVLTQAEHALGGNLFVIPTLAPTKLMHARKVKDGPRDVETLRNPPRYQKSFIRDIHYAVHIAKTGFTRTPVTYTLDPTVEQFEAWVLGYEEALAAAPFKTYLSADIETPYKKKIVEEEELEESEAAADTNTLILRVSFSYTPYTGVSIPWDPRYYHLFRRLFASPGPKVGWNFLYFDIPVLDAATFPVAGTLYDGMDAWHFLYPQLDKGLEAVSADATDVLPWKHLSDVAPEWYSAADADVALRNFLYTIERIERAGAWQVYSDLCVEVMDYMRAAGARGVPLDAAKQLELAPLMDAEIARLDVLIQAEVPEELKPRQRYKRVPAPELQEAVEGGARRLLLHEGDYANARTFIGIDVPGENKTCSHCGALVSAWGEHMKGRSKGTKKEPDVYNRCKAAKATSILVPGLHTEWDEVLPFNANSSTQLLDYMRAHDHPLGKSKKDPTVDAADAAHLTELEGMFGDDFPLYPLALDLHKVKKAKTTYMPVADANGLIHTTYCNVPWTWRFGARALNLQNWGKKQENKWAKEARLQIVCYPGSRFVQADSSSAEAVIQGYFMADMEYILKASQGIHAWLATKHLRLPFDEDSVEKVKRDHGDLYRGMKVANFLINFGGSAYALHMGNKKLFPKKADAFRMFETIYELIPKLEAYHYNLRGLAQKQGYIVSPWGMRFDFFDVYTYDRDARTGEVRHNARGLPMLKLGKDGKAVVAALPQHSNGMFSRENAVIVGRSEFGQYMPANFAVHDSYNLHVPVHLVEKATEFLVATLTRPIEKLGGLRLGAEVEVGQNNWADYSAKNPLGMKSVCKVAIDSQNLSGMPNFKEEFAKVA